MAWKVIQYQDPTGQVMVARLPPEGTAEFTSGTQLIVQEGQLAVFFHDGRPTDGFWAGRHALETQNLPVLARLLNLASLGASPFRSYVCFIALKTFTNLGWGTPTPILFRDSEFRMVNLRAHGAFSIRVGNPEVFLQTIMGTQRLETMAMIEQYLRSLIVSRFAQALPNVLTTVLDLPKSYEPIAVAVKQAVRDEFEQYGLELVDLVIEAITLPPEVQQAINRAAGSRVLAPEELERYERVARSDALRDAAKQPGGGAGEAMSAGLGIAAGMQMTREAVAGPAATPASPALPPRLEVKEARTRLLELKGLVAEGLITEADFEAQKRRLLDQV